MDFVCSMHETGRSGEVCGTVEELSRLARCRASDISLALDDLRETDTADISEKDGIWKIRNRRMRREFMSSRGNCERQQKFREKGGGDPERWTAIRICVLKRDEHKCGYCGRRATTVDYIIPRSKNGTHEFSNLVAACSLCNGKKNNRTMQECGMCFHPSFNINNLQISNEEVTALVTGRSQRSEVRDQRSDKERYINGHSSQHGPTNAQLVIFQKEMDRIGDRLNSIRDSYSEHQSWTEKDRTESRRLKARREELKKLLGVTI